jgi:hypothetical protein
MSKNMRRNVTKMKNTTAAFHFMDMFNLYSELDGQEDKNTWWYLISVPQWIV